MGHFTLITGGARSGKSAFAEGLAQASPQPVVYLATAQIYDEEMAVRIKLHQERRPAGWQLIEEPYDVQRVLADLAREQGTLLLDCVTLWLSNLVLKDYDEDARDDMEAIILSQVDQVARIVKAIRPDVIMVTNEVGWGIVPENPLARFYRDLAGRANQILARAADQVYLVAAGYPMEIKQGGQRLLDSLSKE